MRRRGIYRVVLMISLAMLLAGLVCSCSRSSILTAYGGRCGSTHCYGDGVGSSYDEAYNDAVDCLNAAVRNNNRCGGQGPTVVKKQISGSAYLVEVAMYNTVDCNYFALTPEEKAELQERQAKLLRLLLVSCLILNTVFFFTLKDEFGDTAYQFTREMLDEEDLSYLKKVASIVLWWIFWMPITRFGFFIGFLCLFLVALCILC